MENTSQNGPSESVSKVVDEDTPKIVINELKEKLSVALHNRSRNIQGNIIIMHSYAKKMDDKENLPINVAPKSEDKPNSINAKIDDLLSNGDYFTDEENDSFENSFIDGMAEEGEEDTPSEDSNAIIEVGEEINTTESEMSQDEDYTDDSFIDDEEKNELLPGEEFDLSIEDPKSRRRIIELSSGSDEEIVRVKRKERKYVKRRNWSRIVRMDSSDDEAETEEKKETSKKIVILEDIRIQNPIILPFNKLKSEEEGKNVSETQNELCEEKNDDDDVNNESLITDDKEENEERTRISNEETEELSFIYPNDYHKTKKRKKIRKRKHSQSDVFIERTPKKRKKKSNVQIELPRDFIQEAVLHDRSNRLRLLDLGLDWVEEKVSLKPSSGSENDKTVKNSIKSRKNTVNFRQLMLYDDKRVKRMKTGQLLKKKMC